MTTPRNRLMLLAAKIKGMPQQDALNARRQLYVNAATQASACRQDLQTTLLQVRSLRTIREDPQRLSDDLGKTGTAIRLRAQEMRVLLQSGRDVDQRKLSEKFESVKRTAKALTATVKTDWQEFCEAHRERAVLFQSLAAQLDPAAGARILALSRQFQGEALPPTTERAMQVALQARIELSSEIGRMNTNGPVETFLREALAKNGDPRAILDPAVREYLDHHPALWKALRVSLV